MDPWRELEEIADIEFDFFEELMQEPSHGHNHGRKKGLHGGWIPLETDTRDIPSYKRAVEPRKHGTAYLYVKLRCRCPKCRAWKSAYDKARRMRNPSS